MSSVKKNFTYNLIYQVLLILLPLITTPYLSRVLGAEKTGIYSYSYSIAYYFVIFAMLGLNNYGNREISKVRESINDRSKLFWEIYGFQFIVSIVVILLYLVYILFVSNSVMNWIMLLYVMSALFDINWFFWGLEEFVITVTRNTLIKLLTVIVILLLVKKADDVYIYAITMTGSMLLSPIVLWTYMKKRVVWIRPSWRGIVRHIKPNIILFIPVIAVSLYKVMDKIMLGNMSVLEEVGFYEYSEKVIAIPICCVTALGTVMLPRMSNLVAKNDTRLEASIIHKSIIFGTGLASAMCFGLIGIANVFVPFFFGIGYNKCIYIFYAILPSCVFLAVANVIRTQYLIPHSMDKEYTISLLLGAVSNLIINFILIPRYQSIGAAIGTLVAEATVCVYQLLSVRKKLPVGLMIKDVVWLTLFGLIMMFIVHQLPFVVSSVITLVIKVIVGIIIFGILLLIKYKHLLVEVIRKKR